MRSLTSKIKTNVTKKKELYDDIEEEFFRINSGKFSKDDDPKLFHLDLVTFKQNNDIANVRRRIAKRN